MLKQKFPVISIVGSTSVGKSEAVFLLADELLKTTLVSGIDIISADSRQVYAGLKILTGADVPVGFEQQSDTALLYPVFFERENIRIYGLSLVTVDHEWSAGEFYAYARQIIERADRENRAVFVVGGTGLYHTHLFGNDKQFFVPPNAEIRTSAEAMSVTQLQEWLTAVAPERLLRMNNSDAHNPRRLVRAIEIAMGLGVHDEVTPQAVEGENTPGRHLFLGLSLDSDTLKQKIEQRVIARFESGALAEVAELLVNDRALSEQVKTTLGFTEITCYLEKKYSAEECKENWIQADFQYSKRQQLWWKKYPEVTWFDKNITNWQESFLSHASGLFLSI